jgi:hypothetical protein
MTERRAAKEPTTDAKSDRGRDAKAEFQAYKQRVEHMAKDSQAAGTFHPGSPVGMQMGFGGWPPYMDPSAGHAPHAQGHPVHPASGATSAGETGSSLVGSLGHTLRLAVDLLNSGLAGGTRILQELSHAGLGGWSGARGGCECHSCCGCSESYCEPCRTDHCCQPSCCGCDCCTPSVGTCC